MISKITVAKKLMLLQSFSGKYLFKRTVKSLDLDIEGVANFEPSVEGKSHYTEHATYYLKGKEQRGYQERDFIWDEQRLYIHKSDGAVLHEFLLETISTYPVALIHKHWCKEDQYDLVMTLQSADSFSTEYTIRGPKKNDIIKTLFFREHLLSK